MTSDTMFDKQKIPFVSYAQWNDIIGTAEKHFGMETSRVAENAGRTTALFLRAKGMHQKRITFLAGSGFIGSIAMVTARFLRAYGADPQVIVAGHPDALDAEAKWQLGIIKALYIPYMTPIDNLKFATYIAKADVIIDALFPAPRSALTAQLITQTNDAKAKTLSLVVPSGTNPETGVADTLSVRATWTLGFGAMLESARAEESGECWLGNAGIPTEVFELRGIAMPKLFEKDEFVRV